MLRHCKNCSAARKARVKQVRRWTYPSMVSVSLCCSLTQIGVTQCPDNKLALQAQLRPRVFQGCTALQHLNLGKKGQDSTNPNRSLPDCCFLEAGIVALYLPSDFNRIGTAACKLPAAANCGFVPNESH